MNQLPKYFTIQNEKEKHFIEEIPSVKTFYDGSLSLNNIELNCKLNTSKEGCLSSGKCGWCNEGNKCIQGDMFGPMNENDCEKENYIFAFQG